MEVIRQLCIYLQGLLDTVDILLEEERSFRPKGNEPKIRDLEETRRLLTSAMSHMQRW